MIQVTSVGTSLSAAVATVLLFGGGFHYWNYATLFDANHQELEGSLKRNDMQLKWK